MSGRSGYIQIVLGLIGAILAGIGTYLALKQLPKGAPVAKPVQTQIFLETSSAPISTDTPTSTISIPIVPKPPSPKLSPASNLPPAPPTSTLPQIVPIPAKTASSASTSSLPATTTVTVVPITPKIFPAGVLVGILCKVTQEYTSSDPEFTPVKEEGYGRGTGVIIDKRGYILTNKHVGGTYIEKATTTVGYGEIQFTITSKSSECVVGDVPKDIVLPTAPQIQAINPTIRIPILSFTAEPLYKPSWNGWSERERLYGDFTILKITGLSEDAKTFGVYAVPSAFPYAELLPTKNNVKVGQQVLSYGAPGDVTAALNELFSSIYMLGAVGQLEKIRTGDRAFRDVPFTLDINMEISGGRSGSPVIWNGYVIGLVHAYKAGNKTQALAVASDAILKYLKEIAGWELES